MNRVERLAGILLLLQEQPQTAGQIARRFEISRRTVMRDIQALCEMGVPVIAREGPGGGYSLPESYRSDPLPLSRNEAFLLLLSIGGLERLSDLPFKQEMATLRAKLHALLPQAELNRAQGLLAAVSSGPAAGERPAPYLEALIEAAQAGRWVKVVYQSSQRQSTLHLLPREVYVQNGLWYARAYCAEAQAERTYRADRMLSLEAPAPEFVPAPPHEELPYDHPSHPLIQAVLAPRAAALLESDPQLGQHIRRAAGGSAEISLRCPPAELDYYARLFASMGADVWVAGPPELMQRLATLGQTLIDRYQK